MTFSQSQYDIRCEWGERGMRELAASSAVVVIVDVMSFSTCVDIGVSQGASVVPYAGRDSGAQRLADALGAELAGKRGTSRYSLSPASFVGTPRGARVALPSPNGGALTLASGTTVTFTACLRNCGAVAKAAMAYGTPISVIPAGERWKDDNSLRPAFEDLVGAGAVVHYLKGDASPEAQAALAAYRTACGALEHLLRQCSSGRELIEMGFGSDLALISEVNVSATAPIFRDGAYVSAWGAVPPGPASKGRCHFPSPTAWGRGQGRGLGWPAQKDEDHD